jgi:hypothetical protein
MGNINNSFKENINKTKARAVYALSSSDYRVKYVKDNKLNNSFDFNNVYENYDVIVRNNIRPSFHTEYSNTLLLLGDNVINTVKSSLIESITDEKVKNEFENYNIKGRIIIREMIDLVNKLENNELNGESFGSDFYNYKFINY